MVLAIMLVSVTESYAQGDNCTTALPIIPGNYTANGPATGAGAANLCFAAAATNADWYVYTPTANGTIDVFSCFGGSDTRLSIYSGSCAGLVCEGSNDDNCPTTMGGTNFASEVLSLPVVGGTDYYIEWDDRWETVAFDWVLTYNCGNAPQSSSAVNLDCVNGQFFVDVTVTDLGSANTIDITNTGGAPVVSGVGLGMHTLGPFPLGTTLNYQIVNNDDPGCDEFSPTIEHFPCPIISCGPDNYTFCYTSLLDTIITYQSANSFALALFFNAGDIEQFDEIIIYDGADINAPILFQENSGANVTGQFVTSTNANNFLTFRLISDAFGDCATSGGFLDSLDYTVSCLNCTNPGATYTLVLLR